MPVMSSAPLPPSNLSLAEPPISVSSPGLPAKSTEKVAPLALMKSLP